MKKYFLILGFGFVLAGPSIIVAKESEHTTLKLPWDDLKTVLQLDKNQVRLSWSEFQSLLSRTSQKRIPPYTQSKGDVVLSQDEFKRLVDNLIPPPPEVANAVLTKALYRAAIRKDSVLIRAAIDLHLSNQDSKSIDVDIFPGEPAFHEVLLDGQTALTEQKNGRLFLITKAHGHHKISLTYSVPRPVERGGQRILFPVVRTPITQVEVQLPENDVDVSFDQALQTGSRHVDGHTVASAVLPPTDHISIAWNPIVPTSKLGSAKVYSDINQHLLIEDDALRVDCAISLQVLQNTINSLDVDIPAGFTVLSVQGDQLGDWILKEGKTQILHIPFQVARKGSLFINMTLEQIFSSNKVKVAYTGVYVKEAVREKGFLGVELRTAAEVAVGADSLGVDRVDTQELPSSMVSSAQRPLLYGFKALHPPYNLSLDIERHPEINLLSSVVDDVQGVSWLTLDGKLVHQITYRMRNTNKQFMEIQLPGKAQLWNAFVAGEPVKPSKKDQKILIPLNRSQQGQSFNVELVMYEEKPPVSSFGRDMFQFPTIDMMVSQMTWRFILPPQYRYRYFGKEFDRGGQDVGVLLGETRADGIGSTLNNSIKEKHVGSKDDLSDRPDQRLAKSPPAVSAKMMDGDDAGNVKSSGPISYDRLEENKPQKLAVARRTVSGVLPIRVQIPVTGQVLVFSKTLVVKETPLTLALVRIPMAVNKTVQIFFLGLIFALLFSRRRFILSWIQQRANSFSGALTSIRLSGGK